MLYTSMYSGHTLLFLIQSNQQMTYSRSDPLSILTGMTIMVIVSTCLNEYASQANSEGIGAVRLVLWVGMAVILTVMTLSFGIHFNLGFIPYGALWRRSRRELQASFRPADLELYQPLEQRAVHGLLRNLLSSPDNFEQHLRQ